MRNIRAEKKIEKILSGRFQFDSTCYDVTVLGEYAEITGDLVLRTTQQPVNDMQLKDVERQLKHGLVEGVERYVFHLKSLHPH